MRIARTLLDQVVAHADRESPNECCGLVAARRGVATAVHPATNVAASPRRFEVDGPELFDLLQAIDDAGDDLGAIYHSHTCTGAWPSRTDVTFSVGWPGVEWIIVGVHQGRSEVRSFRIDDGVIREVALELA